MTIFIPKWIIWVIAIIIGIPIVTTLLWAFVYGLMVFWTIITDMR